MTRTRTPALVWFLALLLPACADPSRLPTADAVFDRYYRAIGGVDRLQAVVTRQMWGAYTEGTLAARTDMAWKRPDSRRVNVHAPGFDYAEGFDGQTWESDLASGKVVVDTGAAFDESFVSYARKGHRVTVLGIERYDDRPAYRVRVNLADGWVKEYLFDRESGLIVALRKAMPIHATGPDVLTLSSYEDWRSTDGLLQPHRFIERESGSGKLLNTLQWDSIRTNVALRPDELGRPE